MLVKIIGFFKFVMGLETRRRWLSLELDGQVQVSWEISTHLCMMSMWYHLAITSLSLLCCQVWHVAQWKHVVSWSQFAILWERYVHIVLKGNMLQICSTYGYDMIIFFCFFLINSVSVHRIYYGLYSWYV
jgi:hypothetical protein